MSGVMAVDQPRVSNHGAEASPPSEIPERWRDNPEVYEHYRRLAGSDRQQTAWQNAWVFGENEEPAAPKSATSTTPSASRAAHCGPSSSTPTGTKSSSGAWKPSTA